MSFPDTDPVEFAQLCLNHPAVNVSALAGQLGISRATLTNIKGGRSNNPTFENINKIVHHFGHRVVVVRDSKKGRKPRRK